ncbi:19991_t:CDS:2, partial [Racocetra persica]
MEKISSLSVHKSAQHTLPNIELSEEQTSLSSIPSSSSSNLSGFTQVAKDVVIETHDDNNISPDVECCEYHLSSDNKNLTNGDYISGNESISSNRKRLAFTIKSIQDDAIGNAIYGITKKVKYPTDEILR